MARRAGGQTYSFPIYCASWLPLAHILKPSPSVEVTADADASAASSPSPPPPPMAVLGGGGGEGRSGVPNALVVATLDPAAKGPPALSPDPVFRLGTEEQVPYRMAVHPRGDGVLGAFPNSCRSLTFGVFICIKCSGAHRSLGAHISKVSLSILAWL